MIVDIYNTAKGYGVHTYINDIESTERDNIEHKLCELNKVNNLGNEGPLHLSVNKTSRETARTKINRHNPSFDLHLHFLFHSKRQNPLCQTQRTVHVFLACMADQIFKK